MISIPPEIRGLVFDCDGTIADTMPLHYRAWCAALGEHGHEFSEALFYEMAGISTVRIMQLLNERHGWNVPVHVAPIEPVVRVIREYAGKLPMAVATGGTRAICTKTLTSLKLIQHFQTIVTADDVAHGKPAPDMFLEAARRLGVAPESCYAFEDGELGLEAARAARMIAIDIRPFATTTKAQG